MIAPIVIDGHTTTVENGNCPWICLSSQLASCRSQDRTLIHQAVSLHACHLHSPTCLPGTPKNTGKKQVEKSITNYGFSLQTWDLYLSHSSTRKSTTWRNIQFVNQFCSDEWLQTLEKKLSLYSLALWNRHSRWGRWHRRRICHIFMAKAATVTIGASALQKVTANGPVGRANTRYDLNHSVTFWWSSKNKSTVFKDLWRSSSTSFLRRMFMHFNHPELKVPTNKEVYRHIITIKALRI